MLASISSPLPPVFPTAQENQTESVEEDTKTTEKQPEQLEQSFQKELSQEDQQKLEYLKSRDREVKTHEQAHLSAAGGLAMGGASFTYEKGPDGTSYAIGGEVGIDTSAVAGDPIATLKKAETIRRAALAPANPSAQDKAVASQASAMANKARAELFQKNQLAGQAENTTNNETEIDFSV